MGPKDDVAPPHVKVNQIRSDLTKAERKSLQKNAGHMTQRTSRQECKRKSIIDKGREPPIDLDRRTELQP